MLSMSLTEVVAPSAGMDLDSMRARIVYLTFFPVFLVMGTIGNVLAVAVMMRKKNRKHAIAWYIAILSLSDTVFLYSAIPWYIVYESSHQTIDISVYARCTLDYFTYYFSYQYSAWILVLISIERFFSIVYPIKAKVLATPLRARQICLVLALILTIINVYHFSNRSLHYGDGLRYCAPRPQHAYILTYIWPIVDAIIYSYLPSALMFTFNGIVMFHMWSFKNTSQAVTINKSFPRVTRMLLIVSVFFICSTLPVETMWIIHNRSDSYNTLLYACLDVLMVMNHSINFYIYCFSAKKFRRDLLTMFTSYKVGPMVINVPAQQPATLAINSLSPPR